MHTPEQPHHHALPELHLAQRWHRARAAYRLANRASHHVLGFTVKLALTAYFLFALVFLFLRYAVLPNIDFYKNDIERIASGALGSEVSISRIYASWRGLRPNLFLGDVQVRDAQGRKVLDLPSVSATLSWWTVLAASPRFHSLEIIRPDLDVRRARDGRLSVAGIVLQATGGDRAGGDWLFAQREVVVREGRVRWTDELRGAPELTLSQLHIVLLNQWNHHRFAVRATPPAALSGPIDLRADFRHPHFAASPSDLTRWSGELYADVRNTNLAGWTPYLHYPFAVASGHGSVRFWLNLDQARLAGFTADLGLADVHARLGRDLPPLELAEVRGRLSASETLGGKAREGQPAFGAHGHAITLTDFSLRTRDGLTLAPTTINEVYAPATAAAPAKFHVSARSLDLATLARLAAQLPMGQSQRQMLADFAPRGVLSDFAATWSGNYPDIASYRVRGRLSDVSLRPQAARVARARTAKAAATAAVPAIPGVDKLSGSIDASELGGTVHIDSRDLTLQLPAWLVEPSMRFDELELLARWKFAAMDQLVVNIDTFRFAQGALKGSLSGRHQMPLVAQPGKAAGLVDVSGTLDGFDVTTIGRFLPTTTSAPLRDWLAGALGSGTLQGASLRLRGDLAHFPFRDPAKGTFKISGQIENGSINYSPSSLAPDGVSPLWPKAEQIDGRIVFDGARLEVHADTARTLGVALTRVKAVVDDLYVADKTLTVDGTASGPLQELLRYTSASPVAGYIGHFTDDARASGNAKLALRLVLPFSHMRDSKVQGALQLQNNDVVLFPDLPPIQAALGKIEFTERGATLNGVGASFMGGPLALTGGSSHDTGTVIRLSGSLSADGIRKAYPAAAMTPVTSRFQGAARYTGAIVVREGQLQVSVDSTLAGLGMELPAPLNKAAADALPLRFVLTSQARQAAGAAPAGGAGSSPAAAADADPAPVAATPAPGLAGVAGAGSLASVAALAGAAGANALERDEIKLSLGTAIAARYVRQRQGRGAWKVVRGGIGVNAPAPEPDQGLLINVNMKSLNVDQWVGIGKRVSASSGAGAGPATPAPGAGLAQYVVPDFLAARASELIISDRKLDNVVVGASHLNQTWQASIDSRQVSGHVSWDEGAGGQGLGRVTARLASLYIPESAKADVKQILEGDQSPAGSIPALDIVAERFELFNKKLGRLELQANNVQVPAGREWRISRLLLDTPDGVLKSTGKWSIRDGVSATNLNFQLDIGDAGKLLERLGFPDTLKRGKGRMSGDISWNGLPYSLDIPSLAGKIEMNVAAGQFLKQDPGAAKLLGVLSLQMLPKILKLDFRDVFSDGLAFEGIAANATITRGIMRTDNLRMHGVAATVLMDGTVDIANESSNLHVVVIPEFNLGTGPLVYAIAVNPVIGLGGFLAQLFLRAPVMKALTYQMQVTGPWKSPIITKLSKGAIAPAPAKQELKP
jgi:uncharacterized protein YhdP